MSPPEANERAEATAVGVAFNFLAAAAGLKLLLLLHNVTLKQFSVVEQPNAEADDTLEAENDDERLKIKKKKRRSEKKEQNKK